MRESEFTMPTVLITGANRGLGLALAERYAARAEWQVIAVARDTATADELSALAARSHGRVRPLAADVADGSAIDRLAHDIGDADIDVLINNAGAPGRTEFGALTSQDLIELFSVNTFAPLLIAQVLRARLARGGKVVNITSVLGSIANAQGSGDYLIYGMSKAALNMCSVKLAALFEPRDVAVLALHPGWVQTRMGGPDASISVNTSADGMLRVIDGLDMRRSGAYLAYDGTPIPW
jgi:NAD(P)-dependent dehydrogenase (short-subunit alcohol dehydrogenase family)